MRSIACPSCGTKLAGSPDLLGVSVRCTKCGQTFTASTANSPYIEGLPPLPRNLRPYILAGAVVASLLFVTGLIWGLNWLEATKNEGFAGGGGAIPEKPEQKTLTPEELKALAKKSGIEFPEDDGPDRLPAPGTKLSPALEKAMALKEAERKKAGKVTNSLHEVVLGTPLWAFTPGQRTLQIGYGFSNNQSPSPNTYTLKLRIGGDANNVTSVPMQAALDPTGTLKFSPEPVTVGTPKPPKIEAWVERTIGGAVQTVSNVVSSE
ncbi:hypothetical protein BH11PLA2_BH11PLA2_41370 [soil metagenome]